MTYSCRLIDAVGNGSSLDCATDGITSFDASTQTFTLKMVSSHYAEYPPGNYKFEIIGSIGSDPLNMKHSAFAFEIRLIDICETATLSFTSLAAPSESAIDNYFGTDLVYSLGGAE